MLKTMEEGTGMGVAGPSFLLGTSCLLRAHAPPVLWLESEPGVGEASPSFWLPGAA